MKNFSLGHINPQGCIGTDLSQLRDRPFPDGQALSDERMFLEAFMGFALDTIQASVLPSQVIDSINFETAHKISKALRVQGFQAKYDEITAQFVAALQKQKGETLGALDGGAIADAAAGLAKAFQREILQELPNYKTAIQSDAKDEVYRSGTDVGLAALGIFPGAHYFVTFAEILKHGGEASAALEHYASVKDQKRAFEEAHKVRKERIEGAINKLYVGPQKQTEFLEAVALLSDIHALSVQRA